MTRWPRFGWFKILAFLLSLAGCFFLVRLWIAQMPLVERYDMPAYVRTSMPDVPFWTAYTLVTHDGHLAMPEEMGMFNLVRVKKGPKFINFWLRMWVYHSSVWWVLRVPLTLSLLIALALLYAGKRLDERYNSEARDGRNLRGPELVSAAQFNKRIKRSERGVYIESK